MSRYRYLAKYFIESLGLRDNESQLYRVGDLRGLDKSGRISPLCYKGDTFVTSVCFPALPTPLIKGPALKGQNLLSTGANHFLSVGMPNVLTEWCPLKMYSFFFSLMFNQLLKKLFSTR